MIREYRTIAAEGTGEYSKERSRFLARAFPVHSQEEADAALALSRRQHFDARHHCYAWIIGTGDGPAAERASDDGEPSGTAGKPMLTLLRSAELTDSMVLVVRYFGGTLLGTGGLVRAYTAAAREALRAAKLVRLGVCDLLRLTMDYPLYDPVLAYAAGAGLTVSDVVYTERVSLRLRVPETQTQQRIRELTQLCLGRIEILPEGSGVFEIDNDFSLG